MRAGRSRSGGKATRKTGGYKAGGKSRKPSRKSRKSRKGRKSSRKGRKSRKSGGGPALKAITSEFQVAANAVKQLFSDDAARTAILADQAKLQTAKREVAAATQQTYKTMNNIAAQLVGTPGSGRKVALAQQAANSQYQTRLPGMYYKRSLMRP